MGGHILHTLFWENLNPPNRKEEKPGGILSDMIERHFGSLERFRKEFSKTAITVEGSGWAALTICKQTENLLIMQIEKNNMNVYPGLRIIMALDVFEHAYYI
ncbi:MAG: superoxide dismutase, partial [Candidatus Methanomethyliaceae archaeon]|nr:superoxide dismutase [Candidatus Methanomethyliaceae archaeon]